MKLEIVLLFCITIVAFFMGCADRQNRYFDQVAKKHHSAVTPIYTPFEEVKEWYDPRLEAVNSRLREGNVDVLFVGNSIIHGLESTGKKYRERYYKSRNAVNMGFGWDWTQHTLWRLDHTDFSHINPKLAAVLIGTNNTNGDDNTAGEIADGMVAVCCRLVKQFPGIKILLLGILPREPEPCIQREKIREANRLASRIADGDQIHYMDLSSLFILADGKLNKSWMPDYLHPNDQGYRAILEVIEYKVAELLGEKQGNK